MGETERVHDLVIRGGTLVDGSGWRRSPPTWLSGGRIAEVGRLDDATAAEEIDASGCFVIPGIIDPHTHLDAQLCWTPTAALQPPRGHNRLGRHVRLRGGALPARRGRVPAAQPRGRRGDPLREHRRGRRLHMGVLRPVPRPPRPHAAGRQRRVPRPALRPPLLGHGGAGPRRGGRRRRPRGARRRAREALDAGGLGFATSAARTTRTRTASRWSAAMPTMPRSALVAECAGRPWQINVRTKFAGDPQGPRRGRRLRRMEPGRPRSADVVALLRRGRRHVAPGAGGDPPAWTATASAPCPRSWPSPWRCGTRTRSGRAANRSRSPCSTPTGTASPSWSTTPPPSSGWATPAPTSAR